MMKENVVFTIERREAFWTTKMIFVFIAGKAVVSFPKYRWTAEDVPNVIYPEFPGDVLQQEKETLLRLHPEEIFRQAVCNTRPGRKTPRGNFLSL
jgi:hypothetical protein